MANMAMTKRSTPVGESLRAGQSTSEDESKSSEHMDNSVRFNNKLVMVESYMSKGNNFFHRIIGFI